MQQSQQVTFVYITMKGRHCNERILKVYNIIEKNTKISVTNKPRSLRLKNILIGYQ